MPSACPTFLRLLDNSLKLYTSLSDIVVLKVSNTATAIALTPCLQCSAVVGLVGRVNRLCRRRPTLTRSGLVPRSRRSFNKRERIRRKDCPCLRCRFQLTAMGSQIVVSQNTERRSTQQQQRLHNKGGRKSYLLSRWNCPPSTRGEARRPTGRRARRDESHSSLTCKVRWEPSECRLPKRPLDHRRCRSENTRSSSSSSPCTV